ncbi:hypothetical protein K0504_11680 [Neiella marina]|uniref:Membrane fusion protein biotin-lipoyl like domain-containing protein n=1 Tax=Neiella holothuriorum TaxID=2870530 RepID=A0ABS7EIW7_9GAMM|nr:hypothetical protein [Neiella holothuriorum]MBW8191696.1 hypothetical protein [Neiella holothuriorum]
MSKLSSEGLFRQQALAYQKNRLAGDIVVAQPVSFSTITTLLVISLAVTALFLWLGEYSRKEVVRGYLVPSKGFLKIYTPRMANVEILHVKEGEQVEEGQPLVTLITERSLANGVDAGESRVQQVELQIRSLENQLAQIKELHVKQLSELSDSKGFLSQELVELAQQAEALEARNVIYQEQLQDIESVYQQGHVTKRDYLYILVQ